MYTHIHISICILYTLHIIVFKDHILSTPGWLQALSSRVPQNSGGRSSMFAGDLMKNPRVVTNPPYSEFLVRTPLRAGGAGS